MTLIYSGLVFLFCLIFVISINLYVSNFLKREPMLPARLETRADRFPRFKELAEEEQQRIQQIRQEDLKNIRRASFISLIPFSLLSFAAGYYLSGDFLNPLSKLSKKMHLVNLDRENQKIDSEGLDGEIKELVESYNIMIDRIQSTYKLQEQFIQDASHEIKTPLAIIQTNLDTILDDDTASKNEIRKAMAIALDGVDNLNMLIEDLLSLSITAQNNFEKLNLRNLLREVIEENSFFATGKKVSVNLTGAENVIINGNEFMLKRAFSNLIDNAIKYSDPNKDSFVNVEIKEEAGKIKIQIADNGVGIPARDLPHIFERFFRADKSRSRKMQSFGLGLSIVKKIVEEHGGEINVNSSSEGTVFEIKIPSN